MHHFNTQLKPNEFPGVRKRLLKNGILSESAAEHSRASRKDRSDSVVLPRLQIKS